MSSAGKSHPVGNLNLDLGSVSVVLDLVSGVCQDLLARATLLEILIWILVWFSGSVRDGEEREVA